MPSRLLISTLYHLVRASSPQLEEDKAAAAEKQGRMLDELAGARQKLKGLERDLKALGAQQKTLTAQKQVRLGAARRVRGGGRQHKLLCDACHVLAAWSSQQQLSCLLSGARCSGWFTHRPSPPPPTHLPLPTTCLSPPPPCPPSPRAGSGG